MVLGSTRSSTLCQTLGAPILDFRNGPALQCGGPGFNGPGQMHCLGLQCQLHAVPKPRCGEPGSRILGTCIPGLQCQLHAVPKPRCGEPGSKVLGICIVLGSET